MAKTVRKVKRGKVKELKEPPAIVVTPPDYEKQDMRVKTSKGHPEGKSTNVRNETTITRDPSTSNQNIAPIETRMADFSVNQLIAELSENSTASRGEIENIQRKLLQQANEILKVNAFANKQTATAPRIIDSTQKYSTNAPIYGRIPVILPRTQKLLDQANQNKSEIPSLQDPNMAARDNQLSDTQLVPERLQETPGPFRLDNTGAMINSGQGNMQRVAMTPPYEGRGVFFYETGSAPTRAPASARAAPPRGTVEPGSGVPPYRMPPALETALPGAPAPPAAPLHTHSAKFPIEREVILSSGDKSSKVPVLQEGRRRGRAVAPDTPPKTVAAWTHAENQQAGTSADFRQYHDQNYGYALQNPGAIPRNHPAYEPSPKPPIPAKNQSIYSQKLDTTNNSQSITVTVETGKDNTRDAPKSNKSVSKTYHTLKDMISSRFKKDAESERPAEVAPTLNNSEERKKPEDPVAPRDGARMVEQGIYGRPLQQNRPDMQYAHGLANNMAYPSPSAQRQLMQQQMVQQQILLQQARSQEMLASSTPQHRQMALADDRTPQLRQMALAADGQTPQHRQMGLAADGQTPQHRQMALGADALYQQYGPPGRRSAVYQREMDAKNLANFTSLKQTGQQQQFDQSHSRPDLRSPQQLEREIVRQGLVVGRRAASHPHLLDEPQPRPEPVNSHLHDRSRRNSHGNLLDGIARENGHSRQRFEERESDDGGFRTRRGQEQPSYEERARSSGRSLESRIDQQRVQENLYRLTPDMNHKEARRTPDNANQSRRTPDNLNQSRRTPDNLHQSRRTPDNLNQANHRVLKEETSQERNDESASQKSADSLYNCSVKEAYVPQPSSSRQTPNRIEDLKAHGKKGAAGSGASSDYDKNGGQSSNVDSGRGSVAYSSGRRPEASLHDTSADSDAVGASRVQPQPGTSQQSTGPNGDSEWVDIVECELRQILEPKLAGMRLDTSGSSVSSVTPPLPPLSPASDVHKRNSLPARAAEYTEERDRRRGRDSPRWHAHKRHSSKRDHHYKKHLFGLDTTDMTSTTTRSLDLSSLLDGRTDSDASTGDARAIRRQLRGLENMYAEVLQLLGVRKPASLASKHPNWESRLSSKRRYGSMSSLPSSSVSSRPVRDKRKSSDHRKKHDYKGINKRFQRLESHVVTLARSVAHLSSEMRTQHLVMQEMDQIRAEIAALRHMYKSQQYLRAGHQSHSDPYSFSNPDRVKRLTKFFGDEPPLMRLFLKKLGYEKYAALLEKEKVGAAELPYVGEDKLRALGVPLGPRMRILKEAGVHSEIHLPRDRDDQHNTTTTLAIV